MDSKIRYTLGKTDRLKSRKLIERLFAEGKSFSLFPFRVLYLRQQKSPPALVDNVLADGCSLQAGFSASSRHFKRAVDRNRIKRLMREAYRLQKNVLQTPGLKNTGLSIFFIYTGKELPAYDLVFQKTALVLQKILKVCSAKEDTQP